MRPVTLTDGTRDKLEFLQKEIPGRVHRYFPDLSSDFRIEVLHEGRPLVRKHSVLFEISVVDLSRRTTKGMFVKIPKRASEDAVRGIYNTLVDLHSFSTRLPQELNVVRPLDCIGELRALVTEKVDGESLDSLLRSGRKAIEHGDVVKNCGRFLRAYHDGMGQIKWGASFSEEFWSQCLANLRDLEADGIPKADRDQILAAFERSANGLSRGVPVCLTAKDYQVRNIIVQKKSIFFIDVTEPRRRTVYDDIATFLNSLTILFWGTGWFFLGYLPPPVLADRFLEGYSANFLLPDLISLFCAKSLCHRWHRALESLSLRRRVLGGAITYVPLRHRINRFFFSQVMNHLQVALRRPAINLALTH